MTTSHKYVIRKDDNNDVVFRNQLFRPADESGFLLGSKKTNAFRKTNREIGLAKRISPFLLVAFCLPLLFTYLFIVDKNDKWFLLFLFLFIEPNILIMDFTLWIYYEGRKKL